MDFGVSQTAFESQLDWWPWAIYPTLIPNSLIYKAEIIITTSTKMMVAAIVFIPELSLLMDCIAIKHKNKILSYTLIPNSWLYRNIKINTELKLLFLWDEKDQVKLYNKFCRMVSRNVSYVVSIYESTQSIKTYSREI